MRKKSKYKPKGVRLDAVNWVLAGMKPVSSVGDAIVVLKAKNHSALTEVVQGRGNRDQIDVLIASLNMCEAYAIHGKGRDWLPEIKEAQDALYDMALRGIEAEKFLFRGPEMQAVNLAMEIHDQQLEESTVSMLEKMTDFVTKQIILKRARPIVKQERQSKPEQMLPA
jgi:cytochrome c5